MHQLLKRGLQPHATQETQGFTQATQGPKHASNLTQAILGDKFHPCHWPLLAFVALHCVSKAPFTLHTATL